MKRTLAALAGLALLLDGCSAPMNRNQTSGDTPPGQVAVMRGMYSYLADVALFSDCQTGKNLPVAPEADNRALERAYLQEEHAPGEGLLVTLEGQIVSSMPMEGPGPVAMLLPVRFVGIQPGKTCKTPVVTVELIDTFWKLTTLGDAAAEHFADQRDVHIVLHADDRLTGSDGCNRLNGGYAHEGQRLTFSRIATTMMACPQAAQQAQRLHQALSNTVRYRIIDEFLELLDGTGILLARFEATPSG